MAMVRLLAYHVVWADHLVWQISAQRSIVSGPWMVWIIKVQGAAESKR
jgi:hypothetical protein